jgi:hypothetical protein
MRDQEPALRTAMGRKGRAARPLALGLLRMLMPLEAGWGGAGMAQRPFGWRWGIDPLPLRYPQPSVLGPTGYFDLLTSESPRPGRDLIGLCGNDRGDRLIAGVTSACARQVATPPPPPCLPPSPPPPPPPAERRAERIVLQSVHCEFDTSRLTPLGRRVLDEAVQKLLDHRTLSVEIEGHSDAIGTEVSHLGLGGRRAAAPDRSDVDDDRARRRSAPQRRQPHAGGESPSSAGGMSSPGA